MGTVQLEQLVATGAVADGTLVSHNGVWSPLATWREQGWVTVSSPPMSSSSSSSLSLQQEEQQQGKKSTVSSWKFWAATPGGTKAGFRRTDEGNEGEGEQVQQQEEEDDDDGQWWEI